MMFSGGGGVLVFAAQRRTISIPLRRTRQTTVVLVGAAERFRGTMSPDTGEDADDVSQFTAYSPSDNRWPARRRAMHSSSRGI